MGNKLIVEFVIVFCKVNKKSIECKLFGFIREKWVNISLFFWVFEKKKMI